jgi:signal transduction histidine kinase/ABC-type amino acid transport substrate-binding protein
MIRTNLFLRKIRLSVWSVIFVLLFVFCANNVSVCVYGADGNSKAKIIKVGFFEFPGYHEQDENGVRSGFGYDILQELCPYTGWEYEYIGYEDGWSHMVDMLDSGEIELLSGIEKTTENLEYFDFSRHPLGMGCTILTFKEGQKKYQPEDYKNWHHLRVGMILNSSWNEIFHKFTVRHEFYYTPVYFENVKEMEKALQTEEIDAIVTDNLRRIQNEVIFEKMTPQPFYFAVKKGNQELLDELDNALDRLFTDKPDVLKDLYGKHYTIPKVRAVCPLFIDESHEQDRHLSKYIQEYLHRIGQINDWDIDVDLEGTLAHEEFLHTQDIICGIIKNEEYQKVMDFPQQPIGKFKTTLLTREDNDVFIKNDPKNWPNNTILKIGYVPCTLGCTNKLAEFANRYLLQYKTVEYPTEMETLQALKDGEIDMVVTAQLQKLSGIEEAAVCGESYLYFAVPRGKEDIFRELNQTIEYIKIYEQSFLDRLANQYLDRSSAAKNRVRVCIYENKLRGYICEYMDRLAEIFNWDIDYINVPLAQAYQYLVEKKVDIVPSLNYTEERAKNCLYSNLDFEVIYFFLATTQDNKKMRPNQLRSWNNAHIAMLDGSLTGDSLRLFLNQHDIKCQFQYYRSLKNAEQSVLDGINDAVYTFTPQGFKPLAVFPSELTYLCINKDKPELKDQIDRGMSYIKRTDPGFRLRLLERHFPAFNSDILMLENEEIKALHDFEGHTIRVDISPEIPPLKRYDPNNKEASGFVRRLLDEVHNNTGLNFKYLPPATSKEARDRLLHGKSDIWVGFGGDTSPLGETVVGKNSINVPLVKVFRRNYSDTESKSMVAAVSTNDFVLRSLFNNVLQEQVVFCENRKACYDAVRAGKADYTIDTLQSAQYTLWKDNQYSELIFKSTLPNEYDNPLRFIYSVQLDETIRNIIDKTLKTFTQDQIHNYLQAVTFTGVKKPLMTSTQLLSLIAAVIGVSLLVVLVFFYRNIALQKKQLVTQKSTSDCLETLLMGDQYFEKAIKEIISILLRYFNAQIGWFAKYEEDGIQLDAMVGFNKKIDPGCMKAIPMDKFEQWKQAQEKAGIQLVYDGCAPDKMLGVREWDDYLLSQQIKTICTATIKQNNAICGNIAIGFKDTRRELTPTETHMLEYFQHVMEAALERKEMINNLTMERDRAVQADKAKSFFFACVSHDIRTPLNAIIGFSELMRYGDLDPEDQSAYLENIVFNSNVLMELVNNILDLSKLDAKSMIYTYEFCDFRELCNRVIKAFSQRAASENLELKLVCPSRMPALKIDYQRIYQLLFNLLGNAVKFTKQGSITLKVDCKPVENDSTKADLEFSVIDTGIGIEKKHFKNIFKPFLQIQNMTQTGGTGLGLSICTLIVEQMGGTIDVQSEVGKGSTFTVKLNALDSQPLESDEEEHIKAEKKEDRTNTASEVTSLLLVDDVAMNLKVLEALCRKTGITDIVKAQSGDEALEILKERHFSAVLTDMWMPGMSGVEFAKHIRDDENLKGIPIYLITADVEFLKHYKKEGFSGCLTKPITLVNLKEIFRKT